MHEMQLIVTAVHGVSPSVCHVGSFGAAFAKALWPLVF